MMTRSHPLGRPPWLLSSQLGTEQQILALRTQAAVEKKKSQAAFFYTSTIQNFLYQGIKLKSQKLFPLVKTDGNHITLKLFS